MWDGGGGGSGDGVEGGRLAGNTYIIFEVLRTQLLDVA